VKCLKSGRIYLSSKFKTREHWIQHITFVAENNAADTHTA